MKSIRAAMAILYPFHYSRFKVNDVHPKEQPLGTVPPNILAVLPMLPRDIEYPFIDRHLILHDARANLIIDYMPNAIS